MGTMSYYLGRYEEAAQAYTEAIRLAPEDHRVWGYLGDANKQIPGKSGEMREAYRKAISLAAAELLINESDSGRIADLAHYHASLGDPARATRLIADALAEDPADGNVYYSAALVYAQAGDNEKAVAAVEQAILKGFPDFLVIRDPQLEPLKDNEKFQRLIQSTATP
jgi:tetratricopeptide (TPR) repeat protein